MSVAGVDLSFLYSINVTVNSTRSIQPLSKRKLKHGRFIQGELSTLDMELNFRIWNFELVKRQHTKLVSTWILILIQIMVRKHRGNVVIKHLKMKRSNSCNGWYDSNPYYPIDYLIYAEFSSFIVSLYFIAARAKKTDFYLVVRFDHIKVKQARIWSF